MDENTHAGIPMPDPTLAALEAAEHAAEQAVSDYATTHTAEAAPPSPAMVRVVYNAPYGTDLPVEAEGRYWFDRSEHAVPHEVADRLYQMPGFVQKGEKE